MSVVALTCCCEPTGDLVLRIAGLHVERSPGGFHGFFNGERPLHRQNDAFGVLWMMTGAPFFDDISGDGSTFQIQSGVLRASHPGWDQQYNMVCGQNWYFRIRISALNLNGNVDLNYVAGAPYNPSDPHLGVYPFCSLHNVNNMIVHDPGEITIS